MTALTSDPPQRVQVIGPAGAGKTGMVMRVLGHLSRRDTPHEVLLVNVGDDAEQLASGAAFMHSMVQRIEIQKHRFANVDLDLLAAAAADDVTKTPRQIEHRLSVGVPAAGYSASLRKTYETARFGLSPSRARQDFEDVVRHVAKSCRPILVIDDTERFVAPASGAVERETVRNLFHHAIRSVAEVEQLDLIVAVHPRYRDVEAVIDVTERYGFAEIHVPELPAAADEPGLARILQRRLDRNEIDGTVAAVVEPEALAQIASVYFINGHDLREVLDLAQRAARAALDDGAGRIAPRHVQPLHDERGR
jgi:Cdc6-like AAA superfamily ATPase